MYRYFFEFKGTRDCEEKMGCGYYYSHKKNLDDSDFEDIKKNTGLSEEFSSVDIIVIKRFAEPYDDTKEAIIEHVKEFIDNKSDCLDRSKPLEYLSQVEVELFLLELKNLVLDLEDEET